MASMTLSIKRNIARMNMLRAGYTKINQQHAVESQKRVKFHKRFYKIVRQSFFGRNWRWFAQSSITYKTLQQAENRKAPSQSQISSQHNMTSLAKQHGVTVETLSKRLTGQREIDRISLMKREYPNTLRTAKLMARRAGVPLGLIVERFNFSSLMRAEQWKQLSIFQKLVQRFLMIAKRNRFSPT